MGFILQLVPAFKSFLDIQNQWMTILFGFAIVIGVASLTKYHFKKIRQKPEERIFSYITFSSLIVMAVATLFGMKAETGIFNALYKNLFDYVYVPLDATIFSLLAFYITSAAFRAFKASSWLSTLLLFAGGIVMLGRVAFGPLMVFGELTQWIMSVPTVAAMRGIKIGIGLGMMATSIKIILGIERSFLGGE
jgi:hypothetical protein